MKLYKHKMRVTFCQVGEIKSYVHFRNFTGEYKICYISKWLI